MKGSQCRTAGGAAVPRGIPSPVPAMRRGWVEQKEALMTQGIDFATLTLQDALDLAILIEEEAQGRYQEFTRQMELHHTPEAASFFRHMADNESWHGTQLSQRRAALFADTPRRV